MDGRVLLFLAAVTVLTGIAFGLAPAVQASWRDAAQSLKEGGRGTSTGRRRAYARHVFVAAQAGRASGSDVGFEAGVEWHAAEPAGQDGSRCVLDAGNRFTALCGVPDRS